MGNVGSEITQRSDRVLQCRVWFPREFTYVLGGLGILAGDHTKSASDLGLPFIGVSLFYRQGYFEQRIAADGWQNELYVSADPAKLPLKIVVDNKRPARAMRIGNRIQHGSIPCMAVERRRSVVYLLDTNVRENEDASATSPHMWTGGDRRPASPRKLFSASGEYDCCAH